MSLGCGENTGWADGFSDCLGPDEDMQAELDRDYPEDQPGFISKVTDNVVKPCLKGAAASTYSTKKAIDSAKIIPSGLVKNSLIKEAAVAGCAGGVIDNALEKTTGIGLVTSVKEGVSLLVNSNTDIMPHDKEMELLENLQEQEQ